jgi:3',5'-cyclic AMP phosphodiesterase CpdA
MFTLAHLSDLHLAARPRLRELPGKRGLGFINWHSGRKKVHRPEVLDAITRDLKACAPDHIAVTGDLVNLSLPAEYARARAWLDALGPASAVTVTLGNHDLYVPGAAQLPVKFWGDYMRGDDGAEPGTFPYVRRRGPLALIVLSSALPTAPLLATGRLGETQLSRLAAALTATQGLFRVVLIHHPPVNHVRRHLRRLTDARQFRRVLAETGAELVLHGHDHRRSLIWLEGPRRTIPVVGVPSASALAPPGRAHAGGFNLFHIDGKPGAWRCQVTTRLHGADCRIRQLASETLC